MNTAPFATLSTETRIVILVCKMTSLGGGAVFFLLEVTMITIIDREQITRATKAIINVRHIATHAKPNNLLSSVRLGEEIVITIDAWRKYCHVAENTTLIAGFKYGNSTYDETIYMFTRASNNMNDLLDMCTIARRKSYREEIKQVRKLLADVVEFIEAHKERVSHNATLTK